MASASVIFLLDFKQKNPSLPVMNFSLRSFTASSSESSISFVWMVDPLVNSFNTEVIC